MDPLIIISMTATSHAANTTQELLLLFARQVVAVAGDLATIFERN
jgi:hypothetical protein